MDPKHEEEDDEEAVLPTLDSMPSGSVGARVLMAKGRKLSTIYSRVSAISPSSTLSSAGQVWRQEEADLTYVAKAGNPGNRVRSSSWTSERLPK